MQVMVNHRRVYGSLNCSIMTVLNPYPQHSPVSDCSCSPPCSSPCPGQPAQRPTAPWGRNCSSTVPHGTHTPRFLTTHLLFNSRLHLHRISSQEKECCCSLGRISYPRTCYPKQAPRAMPVTDWLESPFPGHQETQRGPQGSRAAGRPCPPPGDCDHTTLHTAAPK